MFQVTMSYEDAKKIDRRFTALEEMVAQIHLTVNKEADELRAENAALKAELDQLKSGVAGVVSKQDEIEADARKGLPQQ